MRCLSLDSLNMLSNQREPCSHLDHFARLNYETYSYSRREHKAYDLLTSL